MKDSKALCFRFDTHEIRIKCLYPIIKPNNFLQWFCSRQKIQVFNNEQRQLKTLCQGYFQNTTFSQNEQIIRLRLLSQVMMVLLINIFS